MDLSEFLDWLYSIVGVEVEVFDRMYDAAKATYQNAMMQDVQSWYEENIEPDTTANLP